MHGEALRTGDMTTSNLHRGLAGERTLMRVHIGEGDRFEGRPLYEAIVDLLRRRGLAGATVTQCIMGFGTTRTIHSRMSEIAALDMPVVVECVDSEEQIQSVLAGAGRDDRRRAHHARACRGDHVSRQRGRRGRAEERR